MATALQAEPRAAEAPQPFRVRTRRRETHDTWTLRLEPVDGVGLDVRPGQFTMVYSFGVGEVPISFSGDPRGPLVHTVRAVGAVTRAICDARRGAVLGIRGPFGNEWPVAEAAGGDVVVVAGGIGLPPLRPALYEILRRRRDFRDVALLYGARTPDDLVFRRELERWRARGDLQVEVTVDAAVEPWRGKVGVVPKLIEGARFDPAATTAFIVGPEIMMRFSAQALLDRGVPPSCIFVSMERNMQCGVGHCGHCQLGPTLICRDGPVYRWDVLVPLLTAREL
ncbi:MAG TPA: FAD/NAD(P)-binding protein [Gaiellaceae bacterium]